MPYSLPELGELRHYLPALAVAVAVYLGLWVLKNVLVARLKRLTIGTGTILDDVILSALDETRHFFMLAVSLYVGAHFLELKEKPFSYASKLFIILCAFQIIIWGKEAITSWTEFSISKRNNDPSVRTTMGLVSLLLKALFIVLVILFALNNLGIDVTTFIAGLGIGGIAVALATQNILGDLFSSLSLVLDKPFVIGDFISMGEWMGTIEHIGVKTTRIRSLSGEQITISNSDLISSRVRNFKRMTERRVVVQLGVTYQTSKESLRKGPELLREIIEKENQVRFDRAHFVRFGASSLDFELVYYVLASDYNVYADIHQGILLKIYEAFSENGLEFAYPTQTLFLEKVKLDVGRPEDFRNSSPLKA